MSVTIIYGLFEQVMKEDYKALQALMAGGGEKRR